MRQSNQSINQSKHICIAPCVANESEAPIIFTHKIRITSGMGAQPPHKTPHIAPLDCPLAKPLSCILNFCPTANYTEVN